MVTVIDFGGIGAPSWTILRGPPNTDVLGIIPLMLNVHDERSAREQLHSGYLHGGGWHHFEGFTFYPETKEIRYPGDPPYQPIAIARLRDEAIILYPHAWVMVLQKDGTFEISRMD